MRETGREGGRERKGERVLDKGVCSWVSLCRVFVCHVPPRQRAREY